MITLGKKIVTLCLVAMLSVGSAVAISGCDSDSNMEDTVEDAGDTLEDAGDEIQDAADDAADEVEDQM